MQKGLDIMQSAET